MSIDALILRQNVGVTAADSTVLILRQDVRLRSISTNSDALILRQNVRRLTDDADQLILRQDVE